jgi:pimeloyl-ACP methyl ester carboxylesterase
MTQTVPGIQYATCGEIELAYQTFGSPTDPTVILVMGLATQMLGWDDEFCHLIADRGYHVVRFDNRDIGLSTHLNAAGFPDFTPLLTGGLIEESPYLLADMADDTIGLVDALGIDRVHVVGASMGGMIVQEIALRHPERLLSATSIMSTVGPRVGPPTPAASAALLAPAPTTEEEAGQRAVEAFRVVGSPGYPLDEAGLAARGRESFRRANDPAGVARQLAAIHVSGDRTERLRSVGVPVLVLHGEADPLVQIDGGRATAAAIPGARLVTYPGMGHDLPRDLWPAFIDEITAHASAHASAHAGD